MCIEFVLLDNLSDLFFFPWQPSVILITSLTEKDGICKNSKHKIISWETMNQLEAKLDLLLK